MLPQLPKHLNLRFLPQLRWPYALVGLFVTVGIVFGSVTASRAISIFDIIRGGVRVIQGIQIDNLSPEQEKEFGAQIDRQIKQELAQNRTPVIRSNHPASRYVNGLGQQLVANLPADKRRITNYTFQVVNDGNVNAFATMGGFVYINSGLMAFAETEAELVSVIGHEMGHIIDRHAIRRIKSQAIQQGLLAAAGIDRDQIVNLGVNVALTLPNSRKHETEADVTGLNVMRSGNYYPPGMPAFMDKLAQQSRGGIQLNILRTHPAPADRANHLRNILSDNPPTATENLGNDVAAYCAKKRQVIDDRLPCSPTT